MSRRKPKASRTPCTQCPLNHCAGLRPLEPHQTGFMMHFKQGEITAPRGVHVLTQGVVSPHLYTVLSGVLVRFCLLDDGRRQITNFMFPGDLLGLQGGMDEPLTHGAEALTDAVLCVFARERILELYREQPRLGFDVTWLAAKEEAALEQHLVSLGRRSARERVVSLALFLMQRGIESGVAQGQTLRLGITQGQIADMLGLSLVHTNRSLQALRREAILFWSQAELTIPDLEAARAYARLDAPAPGLRPFI